MPLASVKHCLKKHSVEWPAEFLCCYYFLWDLVSLDACATDSSGTLDMGIASKKIPHSRAVVVSFCTSFDLTMGAWTVCWRLLQYEALMEVKHFGQ